MEAKTNERAVVVKGDIKVDFANAVKTYPGNKSAQFRYLFDKGHGRGPASKQLGTIYQFANNVYERWLAKKTLVELQKSVTK